jgi:hypothetical protein
MDRKAQLALKYIRTLLNMLVANAKVIYILTYTRY